MLGFVVGQGKRKVQPGKAQALDKWPDPKCIEDVTSFRAYANFLREFIPSFLEDDQRLKVCTKKGADFEIWEADPKNLEAFHRMRKGLATSTAMHVPDYHAAQDPESGRPFELYCDACDYGWGCTLVQREGPEKCPKPICAFSKSFNSTEQAWSTFERELAGLRDSMLAVDSLVRGFPMVVYTDHKNNLFTASLCWDKRRHKTDEVGN